MKESVKTGITLPGWYNYPSVCYNIALVCALPEAISAAKEGKNDIFRTSEILEKSLSRPDFRLRVRRVFHFICSLSLIWLFFLVKKMGRSDWEGLGASAILAASWEFAYHSRWIAPDGILVQMGLFTFLCLFSFLKENRQRKWAWFALSTVFAAFTCGTKYYGGLFLLPIIWAYWQDKSYAFPIKIKRMGLIFIGLLFTIAFIFTTPGALVESVHFVYHVRYEMLHYSTITSDGIAVANFWEHAGKLFLYLSAVSLSPYLVIAFSFFGFAVLGAYDWAIRPFLPSSNLSFNENWKYFFRKLTHSEIFLLLLVTNIFFFYISSQKILIVRNDLIFIPFLALFAIRGIFFLKEKMPSQLQYIFVFSFIVMLIINYLYIYHAAETIMKRGNISAKQDLIHFLKEKPKDVFYPSEAVQEIVGKSELSNFSNISFDSKKATKILFLSSEYENIKANFPKRYTLISGSLEVNFDYYPNWKGRYEGACCEYERECDFELGIEPPLPYFFMFTAHGLGKKRQCPFTKTIKS